MTTLKIGDKAPEFEVKNQNGEIVKLSNFSGKKIVLFFYPKASTPRMYHGGKEFERQLF